MEKLVIPHTNEDEALQEAKESSGKIGGKVGYGMKNGLPCYMVRNTHGAIIESHTFPSTTGMPSPYYQSNCQPT